jgi:ribosome-associated heat shock protein Hsp15
MSDQSPPTMRLDKWLWHARFVKTRSLAQKLVEGGKVRLNGEKQSKGSANIRVGDAISFAVHDRLHTLRVMALSERRGPASEAQGLYQDIEPVVNLRPPPGARITRSGKGRPSKKERRAYEKLTAQDLPFDPEFPKDDPC